MFGWLTMNHQPTDPKVVELRNGIVIRVVEGRQLSQRELVQWSLLRCPDDERPDGSR
jgi:hypothetical protein